MDPNHPISDLPPITGEHAAISGDSSPAMPTNHLHPPYAEMITAAITALKDRDGSSRQAISKYIEKEYNNLPPIHSVLLTHHLKRMKNQGQLIMVKHSYMLPPPRSVPFQPTVYHSTLDFSATSTDATATTASVNNPEGLSKRKPGRPPKLRPDSGFGAQAQAQVQVQVQPQMQNLQLYDAAASADVQPYEPQFQYQLGVGQAFHTQSHYGSGMDSAGGAEPLFASLGLGDDGVVAPSSPPAENTAVAAKRGRGRPPKVAGVAVSGGGGVDKLPVRRPKLMSVMMGANGGRVKRGRGRPKRIGIGPVTVPLSGNVLRPRGRPKRAASRSIAAVNGGVGEGGLGSRRRGRPSKSGGVKLTGKSFGSPSKVGPGTAVLVTDPQQLVAYQELKNKYELLQSKVKQVVNVVKSCIDPNYGAPALGALHELEAMAGTQEPTPFIHN